MADSARTGLFIPERNNYAAAEIIIITMFVSTLQVTYTVLMRGKLSETSKGGLPGFYRNLVWTGWFNTAVNVLILFVVGVWRGRPAMIYAWFEVGHIVTSMLQARLRTSMAKFMLMHTQTYTPWRLRAFVAAPYMLRFGLVAAAFGLYRGGTGSEFLSFFCLISGEFVSSTFDIIVLEYAHVVRSSSGRANGGGGGGVSLREYLQALNHPRHFGMLALIIGGAVVACVGFYAPEDPQPGGPRFYGYLQAFGILANVAAAYAHRELLVDLIEIWLLSPLPGTLTQANEMMQSNARERKMSFRLNVELRGIVPRIQTRKSSIVP